MSSLNRRASPGPVLEASASIFFKELVGTRLGAWIAHGEGNFSFSNTHNNGQYQIPLRFSRSNYPANPNGSVENVAAVVSADGRHLAMMPHLERSILPWQWPYYPIHEEIVRNSSNHADNDHNDKNHTITPWMLAFVSARKWVEASSRR